MTFVDFNWFRDKILEELGWIKRLQVINAPDMTPEEWVTRWIAWADSRGFLIGTNTWAMIARPVTEDLLQEIRYDYFGTIFEWNISGSGDVAVVDYAYGPGHIAEMIGWMKLNSGCKSVIWERQKTGKITQLSIGKLPSVAPFMKPEDTGMARLPAR